MDFALRYAINAFLATCPWYIAVCVPFIGDARYHTRLLFAVLAVMSFVRTAVVYVLVIYTVQFRLWEMIYIIMQNAVVLLVLFLCFREQFVKILCSFMVCMTFAALTECMANAVISTFIGFRDVPGASLAYTAAILASNALSLPLVIQLLAFILRRVLASNDDRSPAPLFAVSAVYYCLCILITYSAGSYNALYNILMVMQFFLVPLIIRFYYRYMNNAHISMKPTRIYFISAAPVVVYIVVMIFLYMISFAGTITGTLRSYVEMAAVLACFITFYYSIHHASMYVAED